MGTNQGAKGNGRLTAHFIVCISRLNNMPKIPAPLLEKDAAGLPHVGAQQDHYRIYLDVIISPS